LQGKGKVAQLLYALEGLKCSILNLQGCTETYYNVEVLHTLASLNVSIEGYNEIEDGLYRENVISLKRMQKNYVKRSNENRLEYEKT